MNNGLYCPTGQVLHVHHYTRVHLGTMKKYHLQVFSLKSFTKQGQVSFARNVWNQCRATQKGRQFTIDKWRGEILKGLKKCNAFCSFCIRRHSVTLSKREKITSITLFQCQSYCKFSTCYVTFNCEVTRDLRLLVKFEGEIHHLLSKKSSRYVTGPERESLKTTLKNKLPRLHYLEKLSDLDVLRTEDV